MPTGATARTLRVVANNLFGRQCSDMSPTSTALLSPDEFMRLLEDR